MLSPPLLNPITNINIVDKMYSLYTCHFIYCHQNMQQAHNSSYLRRYRPNLQLLFLFGMCAFTIRNGRAYCSRNSLIYSVVHFIFIIPFTVFVVYLRIQQSFFKVNLSVSALADCIQLIISLIIHWICLVRSIL